MREIDMQTFDGTQPEIPRREQINAGNRLGSGISRLLARHEAFVDVDPTETGGRKEELRLHTPVEGTDNTAKFSITRTTEPGTPYVSQKVDVRFDDPEDIVRSLNGHAYEVDNRGIVRRFDMDVAKALEGDTQRKMDPDELVDLAVERFKQMHAARDDERALGVNDQPVAGDEIEAVLAGAEEGDIPPVSISSLDEDHLARLKRIDEEDYGSDSKRAAEVFRKAVDGYLIDNLGEDMPRDEDENITYGEEANDEEEGIYASFHAGVVLDADTEFKDGKPQVAIVKRDEKPLMSGAGSKGNETFTTLRLQYYVDEDGDLFGIRKDTETHVYTNKTYQELPTTTGTPLGVDEARRVRDFLHRPQI
jgi:hypothetical protein